MLRILPFIVCLIALAAMTGCDLFDPSETVTGAVVDASTGAPIPDALVEVGYVKPSWCEIITGKPCGPTPFEVEGRGTTGASGAFSVTTPAPPEPSACGRAQRQSRAIARTTARP